MGRRLPSRHRLGRGRFSFYSSPQPRQMQSSVLRVPHLPGGCERQVLSSVSCSGWCLGESSLLVETPVNVCRVPSPKGAGRYLRGDLLRCGCSRASGSVTAPGLGSCQCARRKGWNSCRSLRSAACRKVLASRIVSSVFSEGLLKLSFSRLAGSRRALTQAFLLRSS